HPLPQHDRLDLGADAAHEVDGGHRREDEGPTDGGGRHPSRAGLSQAAPHEVQEDRSEQRRGNDEGDEQGGDHPDSSDSSSTDADSRRRKIATMIARPTTTSAAATTSTKNTDTCPSRDPRARPAAMKVRFTALSINSTHMNMIKALRRTRIPSR